MPGRRATPTETLKLRGSWRAKGRTDAATPPGNKKPRCPAWLSDRAKKRWAEAVPGLHQRGLICELDRDALVMYCQTYATWERLVRHARDGVPDRLTTVQEKHYTMIVSRLAADLGLTPAARTKIPPRPAGSNERTSKFFQ